MYFLGLRDGVLHVVVAQVEVAARGDGQRNRLRGQRRAQGSDAPGDALRIEAVDVVGVGRGDYVRDTVIGGDAGHGYRRLEVGRSVVKAGKQMVVKVDHSSYRQSNTAQEI